VRTAQLTEPGFHHDLFSAFYPLAVVSPAFEALHLEEHGLVWRRSDVALAHVFADGRAAALGRDVDATAASVERFGTGDGEGWREMVREWDPVGSALLHAILDPFPPVAATAQLVAKVRRPMRLLDLARTAVMPVRRLTAERFEGEGASMLLAGCTAHTDLSPE